MVLVMLNLLAFLLHTVPALCDEQYRRVQSELATRQTFFNDLQALTRHLYFDNWQVQINFMFTRLELDKDSPSSPQRRGKCRGGPPRLPHWLSARLARGGIRPLQHQSGAKVGSCHPAHTPEPCSGRFSPSSQAASTACVGISRLAFAYGVAPPEPRLEFLPVTAAL